MLTMLAQLTWQMRERWRLCYHAKALRPLQPKSPAVPALLPSCRSLPSFFLFLSLLQGIYLTVLMHGVVIDSHE